MTSLSRLKKDTDGMNKREFDKYLRKRMQELRKANETSLVKAEQEAFEEVVVEVAEKVKAKKAKKNDK